MELLVYGEGKSSIGTNKLEANHAIVKCGVLLDGMLAFLDDDKWTGMAFVSGTSKATTSHITS